jgi:hypothetical protein
MFRPTQHKFCLSPAGRRPSRLNQCLSAPPAGAHGAMSGRPTSCGGSAVFRSLYPGCCPLRLARFDVAQRRPLAQGKPSIHALTPDCRPLGATDSLCSIPSTSLRFAQGRRPAVLRALYFRVTAFGFVLGSTSRFQLLIPGRHHSPLLPSASVAYAPIRLRVDTHHIVLVPRPDIEYAGLRFHLSCVQGFDHVPATALFF